MAAITKTAPARNSKANQTRAMKNVPRRSSKTRRMVRGTINPRHPGADAWGLST